MGKGRSDAARTQELPAPRLWQALYGFSIICGNTEVIEAEAERRSEERKAHLMVKNVMGQALVDRANRRLAEGASFTESCAELGSVTELSRSSPSPASEGMREAINLIAGELMQLADEAEQAILEGGAVDLDNAMGPNVNGQPRSSELASLFDEARSLSTSLQIGIDDPRAGIDNCAERLRALGARLNQIRNELRNLLSIPSEHRPKGMGYLAGRIEKMQAMLASLTDPKGADRVGMGRDGPRAMTWEVARLKAEAIVKREGFPRHRNKASVNRLAKKVGCSPSTMKRAIEESPALRRAQTTDASDEKAELRRLAAEQELDARSNFGTGRECSLPDDFGSSDEDESRGTNLDDEENDPDYYGV